MVALAPASRRRSMRCPSRCARRWVREPRATLMSAIENLDVVSAEPPAKVIVNARTGTVVINSAVRVGPAAVTHGKLTVRIDEKPADQPAGAASARARPRSSNSSSVSVDEEKRPMFLLDARSEAGRYRQGGERDRRIAGRPRRDPRSAEGSRRAEGGVDRPVTDIPSIASATAAPTTGISVDSSRLTSKANLKRPARNSSRCSPA